MSEFIVKKTPHKSFVDNIERCMTKMKTLENRVNTLEESGGGSGGSTTAIIDVDTLPTENINANAFYRVSKLEHYTLVNGEKNDLGGISITIRTVDTLPSVGEPFVDDPISFSQAIVYLQTSDSKAYMYIDEALSEATQIPSGWMEAENIFGDYTLVTSPDEATEIDVLYVVPYIRGILYTYDGTEWVEYVTKTQLDEAFANVDTSSAIVVDYETVALEQFREAAKAYSSGNIVYILHNNVRYLVTHGTYTEAAGGGYLAWLAHESLSYPFEGGDAPTNATLYRFELMAATYSTEVNRTHSFLEPVTITLHGKRCD